MAAFFGLLLSVLGTTFANMIVALATEKFIKRIVYRGLKALADCTDNPFDNEVVRDAGVAWGLEKE